MILRSVKHMTSMERQEYHRKFMPNFLGGGGEGGVFGVASSIGLDYSLFCKKGMCFS